MAFHNHNHHHQNHQSTTTSCCCHPPPHHSHHPLSSSSSDPFLIATIISQLLQPPQTPQNPINNHHLHPHSTLFLSSLIRRVDNLENSLNHFSSSSSSSKYPSFYLKDAAARVIQTRFRVFLVRRSRTLGQLKELANVKSSIVCLKSLFSNHAFVDFDSISRDAMDLLIVVDCMKGEDKMIRDSKKSITREIIQFLELIDGVCVKRHQVMTRKIRSTRVVRKDKGTTGYDVRGYSERAGGSKSRNVDNEEKKLIANLRERVERIGKMSRALEEEEVDDDESQGFEYLGDEDCGAFNHIRSKHGLNNGLSVNKRKPHVGGSKGQNVDNEGKRIIANLKERVERIGKVSRELEEEEVADDESEGYEHLGEENGGNFNHIRNKHGLNNGVSHSKRTTHVVGSKGENVDNEGKRMIANLKERVNRIGKMSRALEEEELVDEETEGFEHHGEEDDGNINHIKSKCSPNKEVVINKSMPHSSGKRVCFVEEGNMMKVYNVDGDKTLSARDVEEIQDSTTSRQDEEEALSDEEQSTQSSELDENHNYDEEFTFPAPEVLKRKTSVKIAG